MPDLMTPASPLAAMALRLAIGGCQLPQMRAAVPAPAAGTLAVAPPMGQGRAAHTATGLGNGRVLIAGGFTGQEDTLAMTELYDASSRRLTSAARMVTPRRIVRPLSGHVHGDRLDERAAGEPRRRGSPTAASSSLAGGADRAEIFDPGTVSFQLVEGEARMAGQFSATAPMANGGVLITGGYGEHLGPQAAAWLYVP